MNPNKQLTTMLNPEMPLKPRRLAPSPLLQLTLAL